MSTLLEGDLQITLPASVIGRKFDGNSHGLSHCMKAVDFIVELTDKVLFVELKDPENPAALAARGEAFITEFRAGQLDNDLKTKFRDSWLYEYAQGRINKPITYLVLMGASTLSDAELLARTDALRRQIPIEGPNNQPWEKPLLTGCAVLNIAAWNKALPDFPVSRVRV